ncbi:MAG: hypothetical protein RIT28_1511 [Pseudomonadota bacterium]
MQRVRPGRWCPVEGVDAALREGIDRRFLTLAALRRRRDGQLGVFAREPIPAGTVLIYRWCEAYYLGLDGWDLLSTAEIDALPEDRLALARQYGLDADFGWIFAPRRRADVYTLDNFLNHSCAPNTLFDADGSVITPVNVAPGEELTVDYGAFTVNYDEPFACACGATACRGRVTRQDWRTLVDLPVFARRRRQPTP